MFMLKVRLRGFLRKTFLFLIFQQQVPLRLPCYDFITVTYQTLEKSLNPINSPNVTGGMYKAL
jgi:hypothetical protein